MSKAVGREPCPKCRAEGGDNQGNNLTIYDDGHGFCFAGHGHFKTLDIAQSVCYGGSKGTAISNKNTKGVPLDTIGHLKDTLGTPKEPLGDININNNYTSKEPLGSLKEELKDISFSFMGTRGITDETMKFYDVSTKLTGGRPLSHGYVYPNGAVKVRILPKSFHSVGPMNDASLFGMDKFQAGSAKAITITEGELDALSVYQMLGSKYPAVSVRSSSSARSDCQRSWDYLNSFERIYLCFDNDDAGGAATSAVASLFNPNKVYHVRLTKFKDANAALEAGNRDDFVRAWWNAKPYLPKGIIGDYASIEEALAKEDQASIASYPFPTLDTMAYGVRSGELVLLTAQEKIGKTEVLRAIEHHILKTTDLNIGIIHLEETEKRSVQGLAGYELGAPTHLPDAGVSNSDVLKAYKGLTRRDSRCFFYTHFGTSDPSVIVDRIRYLVTVCGCKCIFLDHLTRLVSGNPEDDIRRTLDWLATEFAILVRDLQFCLFLICHVNDEGKPRDSRMIAKECNLHIYLSRDKESSDPNVRNRVDLMVRDNRFGSITGPAGVLSFDPKTFKLTELPPPVQESIDFDPSV